MKPASRSGNSLVEVLVALAVVAVAMLVMVQQLSLSYRETGVNQFRVFAYQKAVAILAELQAGIERGTIQDTEALDGYSDRGQPNYVLTTLQKEGAAVAPDHSMSGNLAKDGGGWVWYRQVDVDRIPNQDRMRYVRIRMVHVDPQGRGETMAMVSSILSGPPKAFPPAQVHDVYLISIAEAPSLWRTTLAIRDSIESAHAQLANGSKNLQYKFHWITKFGYGRNPCYVPYVNATDLATTPSPWAYWYPGLVANGTDHDTLYSPETIAGRVQTEVGIQHDYDAVSNPLPHAVADQWNHCLRYPEAKALYDARLAAGLEDPEAPPLQILLEDMCADASRYRNAIFVNLHGSAVPFPPLRNYSDPAKDDTAYPGVRAVTHASKLRPARDPNGDGLHTDSEDCEFRVHAYATLPTTGLGDSVREITLEIPGLDVSHSVNGSSGSTSLELRFLPGGFDTATNTLSTSVAYSGFDTAAGIPTEGKPSASDYTPHFQVSYAGGSTWVQLYNTPLGAPAVAGQGLAVADRLYGYEYVPSPISGNFQRDLATTGTFPKNTARWRLRIPKAIFASGFPGGSIANADRLVRVRTTIGLRDASSTIGTMYPSAARTQPENLSTTYAWWASSPLAVPVTERFQLLGDPRHNPYADLCSGGSSWPDGYSWYFQDLQTASGSDLTSYPCLDATKLHDGFADGILADVPRAVGVWRQAMLTARAVSTWAAGAVAKHFLIGGEVALPPDVPAGEPGRVSLSGAWFGISGTAQVDSVTNGQPGAPGPGGGTAKLGEHVLRAGSGDFWVKPWLGELCPPSAATSWATSGNVGSGYGTDQLLHSVLAQETALPDLPRGTDFAIASGKTIGDTGAATLFQYGNTATKATIAHLNLGSATLANKQAPAQDISSAAHMPLSDALTAPNPFRLDAVVSRPDALLPPHLVTSTASIYPPTTLAPLEATPLFQGPTVAGANTLAAAGLRFSPTASGAAAGQGNAFATVLGLTPVDVLEQAQLAQSALVFPLRALHAAGVDGAMLDPNVEQLPRVELVQPQESKVFDNPATMALRWKVTWKRFDGSDYTPNYAMAGGLATTLATWESHLRYVVLVSIDQGATWKYVQNLAPAKPLARPTLPSLVVSDVAFGDESFVVSTSDPIQYPAGEVIFRVEAFSNLRSTHVSAHQVKVSILR